MNPKGGNTEFADMRAAYDALDDDTKAEIEDMICEHSLMYSRGSLGFLDYTEEEKQLFKPVLHATAQDVAGSVSGTVSPDTAHEWQSWRRSLYQLAPLLFRD